MGAIAFPLVVVLMLCNNLKIQWLVTNSYFSVTGLLETVTLASMSRSHWSCSGCGLGSVHPVSLHSDCLNQMTEAQEGLVKIHDVS